MCRAKKRSGPEDPDRLKREFLLPGQPEVDKGLDQRRQAAAGRVSAG